MATQLALLNGFTPRPKIRVSEAQRLIEQHRIIVPCPSRQAFIKWIEEGKLEGRMIEGLGWHIYEDSFYGWLKRMDTTEVAA